MKKCSGNPQQNSCSRARTLFSRDCTWPRLTEKRRKKDTSQDMEIEPCPTVNIDVFALVHIVTSCLIIDLDFYNLLPLRQIQPNRFY